MGHIIGQDVKAEDPNIGKVSDFLSLNTADGSFRSDAIKFSPDRSTMYITSIGIIRANYHARRSCDVSRNKLDVS